MCVCSVAQSCPTLCYFTDCSLSGFSVHGIFPAKILEWTDIFFSRESSWRRDRSCVSPKCSALAGKFFTTQPPGNPTKITLTLAIKNYYWKAISLQLIKINEKNLFKKKNYYKATIIKTGRYWWKDKEISRTEQRTQK